MTHQLSTSLTLIRRRDDQLEIFWGRRCPDRIFLGGFHAYFAGSVEPIDDHLLTDEATSTPTEAAALRECFEECGLLFTTDEIQRFPLSERTPERLTNSAPLATSRLHCFGTWTTPDWLIPNFTTAFYGLLLTDDEGRQLDDLADHLDPREFESGCWLPAHEALRRWHTGEAFLTTPLSDILRALTDHPADSNTLPTIPTLGRSLDDPPTSDTTQVCGGITLLPLTTPTLPPATHTNAIIAGDKNFVVIDPGPSDPDHIRPLLHYIQSRQDQGHNLLGVLLTHHHPDHIGGLQHLRDFTDTLFAHPNTLALLPQSLSPPRFSAEGEVRAVSEFNSRASSPGLHSGGGALSEPPIIPTFTTHPVLNGQYIPIDHPGPLKAIHTPGHAPGHLAFSIPSNALIITGDLVASTGSILINPADGNMGDYLSSLRRIRDLQPRFLLPSHGYLIARPTEHLDAYIDHRNQREILVLKALQQYSPATSNDLVFTAYPDVPEAIYPIARLSLLAHLEHLVEQGLARRDGDLFASIDAALPE